MIDPTSHPSRLLKIVAGFARWSLGLLLAFWLLLTPFTLLNVAARARPAFSTHDHPRLTGGLWGLTRLLGVGPVHDAGLLDGCAAHS